MTQRSTIKRINLLSIIIVVPLLTLALTLLYIDAARKTHRNYIGDIEETILSARKVYLREAINRTIDDIEHERSLCQAYNSLPGSSPDEHNRIKQVCDEKLIRELIKSRVRSTRLKDQGYIWINEIRNFDGGDDYAVRLVHPNMPETEGMSLSTHARDIKGNTPYLTELEGVRKYGEIFFDYWFKKLSSEQIAHKITFAKLYEPWNWVIATGAYLDDIEVEVKNRSARAEMLLARQERTAIILAACAALAAILLSFLFNRRIDRVIDNYQRQVSEREEELQLTNTQLEERVSARTREAQAAERHYHMLYDNAPISLWLEDFSALKERIDELRAEGIRDFCGYFTRHPEVVAECAELVRIIDVNQASVRLHRARSKAELLNSLTRTFTEESYQSFTEELVALAEGERRFATDGVVQTLDGERIHVHVDLFIEPLNENWSRVYLSLNDINARKHFELELEESREHLEEEVEKRTEELRKTVDLMAGREVRMAELKQEIQHLETLLKEAGVDPASARPDS